MRETLSQCQTWPSRLERKLFLVTLFLGKISCLVMMVWPKVFCVNRFLVELGESRCVCPSCCTHGDIDWSATVFSRRRTSWPCAMCSKHTSVHTSSCQCLFQPPRNGINGCCVWCEECYRFGQSPLTLRVRFRYSCNTGTTHRGTVRSGFDVFLSESALTSCSHEMCT